MIKVANLEKTYGKQILFRDLSFNINKCEKIGLVGRNGHGKTTLFQLILGYIEPDDGSISTPRDYRIGHMEQHIRFSRETVLEEACMALPESEKDAEWKVEKTLFGLGFSNDDMHKHPSTFSGGYQIRLNLAKVLVANPDLLLLDEPNNYLDIVAIRWLTHFLKSWKNELMLITHDRQFMDGIVTHTMIIHRQKVRKIPGNTKTLYNKIALEEEVHEKTRLNDQKKREKTELYISRFRAKARLAGLVQSRIKALQKEKKLEKLEKIETLDFSFNSAHFPAAQMMGVQDVSFSYSGKTPYLINNFSINIGKAERICVIGKNGKGKSTLLRILAGELEPLNGRISTHPKLKTGYFGQTNVVNLNPNKTVVDEIMNAHTSCLPQVARSIAGAMMFSGDAALKKISVLSGGEKSRVLLGKLLVSPSNLLLLDEPTNHLDMESCDSLIGAIAEFDGSVLMVTHNEMYLHALAERLIIFDQDRVSLFEGSYQSFLDSIGWQDENELIGSNRKIQEKNSSKTDRKALKKMKAKLLQEKARVLNPLTVKIKEIESAIERLESEFNTNTELLIKASTESDGPAIAALSKKNSVLLPEIKELYDHLEEITSIYEKESLVFQNKLKNL